MTGAANVIPFPHQPTTFRAFWDRGFKRLIPIVPVDAPLSENSTLALRMRKDPTKDGRGKTPGVRGPDGRWHSFDWASWSATESDLERWTAMGAGVGVQCGGPDGLVAIDADTLDTGRARIVRDVIEAKLGRLPVRVGRYPKALYVCRVDAPLRYARVEFGERDERGRSRERVELLTDGRQFVAAGVHPQTREPYAWTREVPSLDALPVFAPETILGVLEALRTALPEAKPLVVEGGGAEIDQASLRGDPAAVRRAVEATPNTTALFPTREAWLSFGYAIKAALPDDPDLALELFQDWSERWDDPSESNDPDYVASEWRRCKPPYRRGASWLYEVAETASAGKFDRAELWFDVIEDRDDPFEIAARREREAGGAPGAKQPYFDLLTVGALFDRPDPRWLIERHLPEEGVGFLYGDPGTGKSFVALDMALSIAYRRSEWHGDAIAETEGVVVYVAGEGAHGFKGRVKAWLAFHTDGHGLGEGEEPRFRLMHQPLNMMSADDVTKLIRSVRDVVKTRAVLIVVDTVSRAIPGAEENLQKDMTLFVQACDRLKSEFGCVVLGVHHAGKSGDMRGSTVLRGAGDFVFKLESRRETAGPTPGPRKGHLICEKAKDAPDGWSDPYVLTVVHAEGGSSLVPLRVEKSEAEKGGGQNLPKAFLTAMKEAWDAGRPWSKHARAGDRWAVRVLALDFGLDKPTATALLDRWERDGFIRYTSDRGGHKGKRPPGYEVVDFPDDEMSGEDADEQSPDNGIFG